MRVRFGIRLLLGITVATALLVAPIASYNRMVVNSRLAKSKLTLLCRRLGGDAESDLVDGDLRIVLSGAEVSEDDALALKNLYRSCLTEDIWWYPERSRIHLSLIRCKLSRAAFLALCTDQVNGLELDNIDVDEAALVEAFRKTPSLEYLTISNMVFGDDSLDDLRNLPLRSVTVHNTQVSQAGVAKLLTQHPLLYECNTSLSSSQIEALRRRFPDCGLTRNK